MHLLAALLVLLLPGIALVRRDEWARGEAGELAAVALVGSAAFWAVGIWFVPYVGLPLTTFAGVAAVGAAVVLIARRRAWLPALRVDRTAALGGALFVAGVVAARFLFVTQRIACSVGDMTAHAYMTELIVLRDGLPTTHEPLLAISRFGQFPPGFHTPAALLVLLGGLPSYRATIHVLVLAVALISFVLYALLRRLGFGRGEALVAAMAATFLTRNPQFFLLWGSGPALLSAAILLLVVRDALAWGDRCSLPVLLRAGLWLAGATLVHPLPIPAFAVVLVAVLVVQHLHDPRRLAWCAANGAIVATAAVLPMLPYLAIADLTPRAEHLAWAHTWFRAEMKPTLRYALPALRPFGLGQQVATLGPLIWPFFVVVFLGALPSVLLAVGLVAGWLRGAGQAVRIGAAVLVAHVALLMIGVKETLPIWPWLYPMRVGVWLLVPLGIATAAIVGVVGPRIPRRVGAVLVVLWLVAFAAEGRRMSAITTGSFFRGAARAGSWGPVEVMAHELAAGTYWVTIFSRDNALFSQDDLAAFDWVARHTDQGAAFDVNYADGGNLLTAIVHRKTRDPHYYLFFYRGEIEAWQARTPADYVYVGSGPSPRWPLPFTAEALDRDARYELVFRSGRASVYRVVR